LLEQMANDIAIDLREEAVTAADVDAEDAVDAGDGERGSRDDEDDRRDTAYAAGDAEPGMDEEAEDVEHVRESGGRATEPDANIDRETPPSPPSDDTLQPQGTEEAAESVERELAREEGQPYRVAARAVKHA